VEGGWGSRQGQIELRGTAIKGIVDTTPSKNRCHDVSRVGRDRRSATTHWGHLTAYLPVSLPHPCLGRGGTNLHVAQVPHNSQ